MTDDPDDEGPGGDDADPDMPIALAPQGGEGTPRPRDRGFPGSKTIFFRALTYFSPAILWIGPFEFEIFIPETCVRIGP